MNEKRETARRAAAGARSRAAAAEEGRAPDAAAAAPARAVAEDHARDVRAALRELGCPAGATRRAVEFCLTLPDATLEERVRAALKFLCPATGFHGRVGASLGVRT